MIKCYVERLFHQYVKHEIKITKSIFICKTIYETNKCMKCFQDVKGFCETICMKPTPLNLNVVSK